jgi:hypothetical protein
MINYLFDNIILKAHNNIKVGYKSGRIRIINWPPIPDLDPQIRIMDPRSSDLKEKFTDEN